ncbi:MAG: hypothetical protein GY943_16820, partial [Chloroflexi bacterium]|nr:hypothetical protein [Chloroflexota bacterium]
MTTKRSIMTLFILLLAILTVGGVVAAQQTEPTGDGGETAVSPSLTTVVERVEPPSLEIVAETATFTIDDEADYPDPFAAAAETLGITVDELWDALENGQSIADLAAQNNVDLQTVIDAMIAAETAFIDALVADGELDEDEAAEWRSEVADYMSELANDAFAAAEFIYEEDFVDPLDIAAETIGIDVDALWEAMENGQSIADLAAENNVDVQTVIDAMVAAETAFIDELLAAGEIDDEEATEWRSESVEFATDLVNNGLALMALEIEGEDPFDVAAVAIGIDIDLFWDTLENGQSIADIAAANNVDVQTVIDAMVTAENEFIDALLADGELDADEAEEWRSEVIAYTTDMVNETAFFEEWEEGVVELFMDEACVIEADGSTLDQLE